MRTGASVPPNAKGGRIGKLAIEGYISREKGAGWYGKIRGLTKKRYNTAGE